jgi:hypothetical protein
MIERALQLRCQKTPKTSHGAQFRARFAQGEMLENGEFDRASKIVEEDREKGWTVKK